MKFLIRRAGVQDARAIAKVQVDTWRTTYKGIIGDEYLLSEAMLSDLLRAVQPGTKTIKRKANCMLSM